MSVSVIGSRMRARRRHSLHLDTVCFLVTVLIIAFYNALTRRMTPARLPGRGARAPLGLGECMLMLLCAQRHSVRTARAFDLVVVLVDILVRRSRVCNVVDVGCDAPTIKNNAAMTHQNTRRQMTMKKSHAQKYTPSAHMSPSNSTGTTTTDSSFSNSSGDE